MRICSFIGCLFATIFLSAAGEMTQAELKDQLEKTKQRDERFHLYEKLLPLQLQSYRESGRDIEALASAMRISTTEADKRQRYIDAFNFEEGEIFTSYSALIDLANELAVDAHNRNLTYHFTSPFDVTAIHGEPFQLYFLRILELEEDARFPVHGIAFWVREQAGNLTQLLLALENEIKAMQIKQIKNPFEQKESKFYWDHIIGLCHEFLSKLDGRWSQCNYERVKILNLIFGKRFSSSFPDPGYVTDCIDQFLPFILKHTDLELARVRFDQKRQTLPPWDLNFEWVALHVKAAKLLLSSDREKAKAYLEKAKKLTEETLWCYSFSYNRSCWNAKQEEARQLINAVSL